jgi:hypothetical protein
MNHPQIPQTDTDSRERNLRESVQSADPALCYFSDAARRETFRAVGYSWLGTPFREHSRAKGLGGGIDCVGFIEEWFFEAGAAPRFNFPRTDGDYKSHLHNTRILSFLRGADPDPQSAILHSLFVELTNLDELVPVAAWPRPANHTGNTGLITGDLLVIKAKIPGVWHLPAMLDDRMFLHCAWAPSGGGVTEGDITQGDIRERLRAVFRLRAQ